MSILCRLSAVSGPYKVNGAPIAVTISSMEIPPKPSNVRMIKRTPYSIRIKWDHTDAGRKNPIDGKHEYFTSNSNVLITSP